MVSTPDLVILSLVDCRLSDDACALLLPQICVSTLLVELFVFLVRLYQHLLIVVFGSCFFGGLRAELHRLDFVGALHCVTAVR